MEAGKIYSNGKKSMEVMLSPATGRSNFSRYPSSYNDLDEEVRKPPKPHFLHESAMPVKERVQVGLQIQNAGLEKHAGTSRNL